MATKAYNTTKASTLPSLTGNDGMKEIVARLERERKEHEDSINYMTLRKLRD